MINRQVPVIIDELPRSLREHYEHVFVYPRALFHRKFKTTVKRLAPMIPPGTTVLDIGGNHGRFAAELSRAHKRNLIVHSFEPLDYNFRVMKLLARLNRNMVIHPFGLSDINETKHLYTPVLKNGSVDHGGSFISPKPPEAINARWDVLARTRITVRQGDMALDELGVKSFSFAKIDVEGHEYQVLRGLRRRIERDYPLLFTEFLPRHAVRDNAMDDLIAWMQSLGYHAVLDDEHTRSWRVLEYSAISDYLHHKGQDVLLWHEKGPNGDKIRDLLREKEG